MTGAAVAYLSKAQQSLKEASASATTAAAGRAAYFAAYQAAQAFIFASTGKVAQTHGGVLSEFARLAKEDGRIDKVFPALLAQTHTFKTIADYAVDASVSLAEAQEAIDKADGFVALVALLLADRRGYSLATFLELVDRTVY